MAKNNKYTQITTGVGLACYPHLRTTEIYDGKDTGKYTCAIKLEDAAETEKLMQRIENEWEMAKKSPDFEGKRYGRNTSPCFGFSEDTQGELRFKAKANAVIKTKTGEIIEKSIPVFDNKNQLMPLDVEVGSGSKIRMCMLLRPFYASSSIYGIQLLLKGVQVLEYVAPAQGEVTADNCGFKADKNAESMPFAHVDTEEAAGNTDF